jgi:hypothetical protein
MMTAVLLCLIGCYLIEVVCGSSPATSNPEIGCEADCSEPSRLTNKQFFLQFLPIIASVAGLLSLLAHFQESVLARLL